MDCVVGRAQILLHQGLLLLLQRLDSFLKEDQSMFTINYLIWRGGRGKEGERMETYCLLIILCGELLAEGTNSHLHIVCLYSCLHLLLNEAPPIS